MKRNEPKKWKDNDTYEEIAFKGERGSNIAGSITIEERPTYCDRGHYLAKIFAMPMSNLYIDSQDGWPRYYFDLERAKLEIEDWIANRRYEVILQN